MVKPSVVIPVYNEEAVVGRVLEEPWIVLDEFLEKTWEVIYVDDGSTNGSSADRITGEFGVRLQADRMGS